MNIAIVGYGKMGKLIERVALEKNVKIVSIIDKFSPDAEFSEVNNISLKNADVVIDFASPDDLSERINRYISNNVQVVMGTTGWYNDIDKIKSVIGKKIGFIWSGNYSLGVNLFFRVIKKTSEIFNKFDDYDCLSYEIHHNEKKDSPSGTELMIGDILNKTLDSKNRLVTEKLDRKIEKDEIHLASVRGGYFPGTHVVLFDSKVDTIELKHTARNREGFAYGAVSAAQWIKNKKGFFNIDDFMDSIIN